jgi:hypothetical protein
MSIPGKGIDEMRATPPERFPLTNHSSLAPAARAFAILVALVAWVALFLQLWLSVRLTLGNGDGVFWGLVLYLGYFTILTNLLAAVTVTLPLLAPRSGLGAWFARTPVISGVTAAIVTVGLSYFFMLRHVWNPRGWQLVADVALHYVMPGLFFVYWLLATRGDGVRWRDLPAWTIFPIAYLAYALVRGAWIGSYPYYFIDVGVLGYRQSFVNALGVLAVFLAVSALLVIIAQVRGRVPST